jgi:hypothetical protein
MRGRKKIEPIKKEPARKVSGWTVEVKILKSLLTPYRISGKVGDIVSVPMDLVDELVRLKKAIKA